MMNQAFDPLNLLILAIAVVVFLRLRSVLGKRTGNERPPLDPIATKRQAEAKDTPGNVINLPQRDDRTVEPVAASEPAAVPVWVGVAEEGSSLAQGLDKIAAVDRSFSPRTFLEGAKMAYEMIVQAFAAGDRPTLRNLLSREVLDGFLTAIDAREKAGNKLESRFVGIDKAELAAADLKGKRASLTVKFVSELISATRNRAGEVIEGDPQQIREITDVWTFERDVSSRDPNWKLAATEAPA
jgi:predicted lipid-binding transport protein (Tim44 family)